MEINALLLCDYPQLYGVHVFRGLTSTIDANVDAQEATKGYSNSSFVGLSKGLALQGFFYIGCLTRRINS
jgi:hypothetical protein